VVILGRKKELHQNEYMKLHRRKSLSYHCFGDQKSEIALLTNMGQQRNWPLENILSTILLVTKPNSNRVCIGKVGPPITILAKLGQKW
jgi:hypothetical protein